MIPVHLDPAYVRVALAGRGVLTLRRLGWLRGLGFDPPVYADKPDAALREAAGEQWIARLPDDADLASLNVLWAADIPDDEAAALASRARAAKVLVNVEDVLTLCDFHTPSIVRRGRLLLSAGTGGASPAAASAVRRELEAAFPPEWAEAIEELREARNALRAAGATPTEIKADAEARLAHRLGKTARAVRD